MAKVKSSDEDGIQRGLLLPANGASRSHYGLRDLFQYPSTCGFRSFTSPAMPIVRFFVSLPPFTTQVPHRSLFGMGAPRSDPQERAYSWFPSSEATSTHELRGSPEAERLYIDKGENVRASGERDEFRDDDPGPPKATEGVLISGQVQARRLPRTVTVSPQSFSARGRYFNT